MLPLKGLRYLEGSWPSYRKQTRSVLPPSQCSLSQQRPLHLILLDRMSDKEGVSMTGRALRNLAQGTNDSSRRETEQFCGGVETYNEPSLRIKYHSQGGVQTSFYESTPSPSNTLGDQISPGPRGNSRHAGTNHPLAPKERDNRGASKFPRVLLEPIPGTKSFRRVASSYRSKESERLYSCTSFPYVHYKHSSKLRPKRRLRVQNRSAGCVLSHTYPSQQQKVPQVRLREQGVPVSGATLRTEHSPSGFYSIGAHSDRLSSPSGDLGDTVSQDLQFLGIRLRLNLGEASLPESKAWEIVARAPIYPPSEY